MYKVLWFDDEHKKFETIKENALIDYEIKLIGLEYIVRQVRKRYYDLKHPTKYVYI